MKRLFAGTLATAAVAATLLSGAATASASAPGDIGITGVGNQVCDYGEVCLFAWPNFDGPTWDANGCGWHILDGWMQNHTSSVKTDGNAVTLWDWSHASNSWVEMVTVPAGSHWILGVSEDRTDAITVRC